MSAVNRRDGWQLLQDHIATLAFEFKQRAFRRSAWRYYCELLSNEQRSSDELEALNWARRRNLLEHACSTVPFYRKRFKALGLTVPDIRRPEDWSLVPVLTRQDIADNASSLISETALRRVLIESVTGGSTGVPTRVFHDARHHLEPLGWRIFRWWGMKAGTDIALCWRRTRPQGLQSFINDAIWWPTRRIWLDAAAMTNVALTKFIEDFNRLRPPIVHGYVGAIHHVAQFARARSIQVCSPRAVWVTSAPISAVERDLISAVFSAPVFDQYGCAEIYWIASECNAHSGLHIFSDSRHLEFLDGRNMPSSSGAIAITDLHNYAFPLIRYLNGDRGKALCRPCPCGVTFPLMTPVKGRVSDMISLPDGTTLTGDYLTTLFDACPDVVTGFQVVHRHDGAIILRVVVNVKHGNTQPALQRVQSELSATVHAQVPVLVEYTSQIQHDRGKTRFIVSHYSPRVH